MSPERWERLLREVVQIGGVRGAAVVNADDGLVVHEAMIDDLAAGDVAALASAVVLRSTAMLRALGEPVTRMVTLTATEGTVIAVQGQHDLWLVAVTAPAAELGRLRLLLGDLVPELA